MAFDVRLLEPAVEFLRTIEPKLRAKAFRTIELLREFGPELPMPHARKLSGHELFELRVRQGSNICRLFYFVEGESVFIVTSGYIKKTEKTDRREIERALRLKAEYLQGEET
jgi:phage-related protein